MEKTRKSSDAQIRASIKYQRTRTVRKVLNFNLKTDADILEYISTLDNFQGRIKTLLRADMNSK